MHYSSRIKRFIHKLFGLGLSLIATHVFAGSTLNVLVKDERTGKAVVAADLRLVSRDGLETTGLTTQRGEAKFIELAAGLYELSVSARGYLTVVEPSVRLVDNKARSTQILMVEADFIEEGEVLVTGRAVTADDNASISASVVNREELRSATGSGSDVLRALDGLPGLFSSGEFASFSVRGRGPRDNLILVDGVPFENVVHFDQSLGEDEDVAGGGRFSVFAPNLVERANFEPGGWSAAYSGRTGSLLRLDIAEGNPESPAFSTRFDITGAEFTYDGPSYLHEATSLLFSVRRYNFGNLFDAIGEEDIGEPILTDLIVKTNTELSDQHSVQFLSIIAPEEYTRDAANVIASEDFEDVSVVSSEQDNILNALTWQFQSAAGLKWDNKLYHRYRDKNGSRQDAIVDGLDNTASISDLRFDPAVLSIREEESEFGIRSDLTINNLLGELKSGLRLTRLDADYRTGLSEQTLRYVYDQNDFRGDPNQQFIVLSPEFVNSEYQADEISYGAYVEQDAEMGNWEWRAGVRYDRDSLSEQDLISPRFSLGYQLNALWEISGTLGRFYQSPRLLDRAQDPQNFELENEVVDHISLGFLTFLGADWRLLGEAYYQDLDKLIVAGDRTRNRLDNSGTGTNQGFDLVLSKRFADGWSANINYSFNAATIDEGEGSFDADFNRPHIFQVGGVWEINERWKLSSRWKFASGRPTDDFIVNDNVLGDGNPLRFSKQITERNADRYDSFHSLNFRVDYIRDLRYFDLIAFLDVINAYGADNPDAQEFNPRTGLSTQEDGSAFPLIGFRLEW